MVAFIVQSTTIVVLHTFPFNIFSICFGLCNIGLSKHFFIIFLDEMSCSLSSRGKEIKAQLAKASDESRLQTQRQAHELGLELIEVHVKLLPTPPPPPDRDPDVENVHVKTISPNSDVKVASTSADAATIVSVNMRKQVYDAWRKHRSELQDANITTCSTMPMQLKADKSYEMPLISNGGEVPLSADVGDDLDESETEESSPDKNNEASDDNESSEDVISISSMEMSSSNEAALQEANVASPSTRVLQLQANTSYEVSLSADEDDDLDESETEELSPNKNDKASDDNEASENVFSISSMDMSSTKTDEKSNNSRYEDADNHSEKVQSRTSQLKYTYSIRRYKRNETIFNERVKTDWKTKAHEWLEDDKPEKEQKKRQKDIYDLKVANAEVARIKRRKEADSGRAYWQMHPLTTGIDKNDL